jgi:hypothetical protein
MTGVLMRREIGQHRDIHRGRGCEETQGEDHHLHTKDRGLEYILSSQPQKEATYT